MAYENQIKCTGCGMSIPDVPEDSTAEERLCNQCLDKTEKMHIVEGTVDVLCHRVSYWYKSEKKADEDTESRLKDEAEERAETCIKEGYNQGELNYESEEYSARGWWLIER